jgi:polyisoprenyl-phosphate glycosyltransferase
MKRANNTYDVDLSVVIPVYGEEDNLEPLRAELIPILEATGRRFEVVFVDDGSRDRSPAILRRFVDADSRLRAVFFARNYGQQMANTAGLRHARGRAVIIMDADMQTPAENIPDFLAALDEGYDIVYGVREKVAVPVYRRVGTRFANWLICRMTGFRIPDSASGFLALDRKLVANVNFYNERARYLSGLFAWLSYGRYTAISVKRRPRLHGESNYNIWTLARLVVNFVTRFSAEPLILCAYAGLALLATAPITILGYFTAILYQDWAWAEGAAYAGLLLAIGGMILLHVGLLGAYVGRIYNDVRQNPLYVIIDVYEQPSTAPNP